MSYNKAGDGYTPPTGPPPSWSNANNTGHSPGYAPQAQPDYTNQQQDRGYGGFPQQGHQQGGYPQGGYPQGGYQQGYPQGGYPQQGYQQQPMYVQQQRTSSDTNSCLMACLGALCICCTLDMLF